MLTREINELKSLALFNRFSPIATKTKCTYDHGITNSNRVLKGRIWSKATIRVSISCLYFFRIISYFFIITYLICIFFYLYNFDIFIYLYRFNYFLYHINLYLYCIIVSYLILLELMWSSVHRDCQNFHKIGHWCTEYILDTLLDESFARKR